MKEAFKYGLLVVILLGGIGLIGWFAVTANDETKSVYKDNIKKIERRLTKVEQKLEDCNKDKEKILTHQQIAKYP